MNISHFLILITALMQKENSHAKNPISSYLQLCIHKSRQLQNTNPTTMAVGSPQTPKKTTMSTPSQCFSSCTSRQYLTNAFLCTSPTNFPSLNTQMYRKPNLTKHSYTKSMGEQISSETGATSM
jgi:hypothetical protein